MLAVFSEESQMRPAALQEWLPSRDNVVFLIDAQAAMFHCAGLTDTAVRPLHFRLEHVQGNSPGCAGCQLKAASGGTIGCNTQTWIMWLSLGHPS